MLTTGRDSGNRERFSEGSRSFGVKTLQKEEQRLFEMENQMEQTTVASPYVKGKQRLKVTNTAGTMQRDIGKVKVARPKVTTKNLVMMIAYSIVTISLSVVIAVNAISLGTLSQKNAQLTDEVTSLQSQYALLSNELSAVASIDRIQDFATNKLELSATAPEVKGFALPGYKTPDTKVYDNNAFDKFLDSLS